MQNHQQNSSGCHTSRPPEAKGSTCSEVHSKGYPASKIGNLGRSFDVFHSTSNDKTFEFFIFWTDHWRKLQKINTGNPFYVLIVFKGYKTTHGCVYSCIQITNSRDRIYLYASRNTMKEIYIQNQRERDYKREKNRMHKEIQ